MSRMSRRDPFRVEKKKPFKYDHDDWLRHQIDPQAGMPVETEALKARRVVLTYRWIFGSIGGLGAIWLFIAVPILWRILLWILVMAVVGLGIWGIGWMIVKFFSLYFKSAEVYKKAKQRGVLEDE